MNSDEALWVFGLLKITIKNIQNYQSRIIKQEKINHQITHYLIFMRSRGVVRQKCHMS